MRSRAPAWLPPSASIDLALMGAGLKPAVRLSAKGRSAELRRWGRRNGLFACADSDGFIVLSRYPVLARRVLSMDRLPGRHTAALGTLLGYPRCCSRAAARVGDEGIDDLHYSMVARGFVGLFALISPEGYVEGRSILSHVPCARNCAASLAIAMRSLKC